MAARRLGRLLWHKLGREGEPAIPASAARGCAAGVRARQSGVDGLEAHVWRRRHHHHHRLVVLREGLLGLALEQLLLLLLLGERLNDFIPHLVKESRGEGVRRKQGSNGRKVTTRDDRAEVKHRPCSHAPPKWLRCRVPTHRPNQDWRPV